MSVANRASGSGTAEQDARLALARVMASSGFSGSVRLQRFLTFIVNETLSGRGSRLKALTIAEAVYDKNVVSSPGSDALVRSEATRLRRVLANYYAGPGAGDPVKIVVPRGAYVPQFVHEEDTEEVRPPAKPVLASAHIALIGAAAAGLGALAVAVVLLWPHNPAAAMADSNTSPPSIAVLPFTVAAGSESADSTGSTFAQETAGRLARFESGLVFSPVMVGVDSKAALNESPRLQQLGAQYALIGIIRQSGGNVHVAAQLVDLKQKIVVWAQTYDRAAAANDTDTVEAGIARDIAVALGQPGGIIVARELASAKQDAPGYGCVIGVFVFLRAPDRNARSRLHSCLEKTVQDNPGYAAAWAALSMLDSSSMTDQYVTPAALHTTLDKALSEANAAVADAPQSALAHQALANAQFRRGDDDAFQSSAQEALKLNPDDPQLLADIGSKYYSIGHYDDGLALVRRGIALNSVPSAWYYRTAFLDAYRNGDFAHALGVLDSMGANRIMIMRAFRVMALAHLDDPAATSTAVHALLAADPQFARHADYFLAEWRFNPELARKAREALNLAGVAVHASLESGATCCAGAKPAKDRL